MDKAKLLGMARSELDPPKRPLVRRGDRCKACSRPLYPWSRGGVPEGYVMHYARGWCVGCRPAYRAAKEEAEARGEVWSRSRGLTKETDRKRHSSPVRCTRCAVCGLPFAAGKFEVEGFVMRKYGSGRRRHGAVVCVGCVDVVGAALPPEWVSVWVGAA